MGTCHIIKTLSVAWDAPCSPCRRFESELSKTALAGYAARDLLPLSSSHTLAWLEEAYVRTLGFTHREGHELAFLRWLDQAGQLDVAHPDSVRAAGSRRSSSCPTRTRCSPYWSVSLRSRVSCCRHYHFCAASVFHAGCLWRRSRDSDTGKQLDNEFAHIFSWIVATGFVQNAADSQTFFYILTCRQVFFLPPC